MKSIFTEEYDVLLQYLISARKKAGLTQQELAGRLERPQSFVSKYERGERRLDIIEFIRVARAIGVVPSKAIADLEKSMPPKTNKGAR